MINPTLLAFDIDGVVADTMSLFVDIARQEYNADIHYQDITNYDLDQCLNIAPDILEKIIIKLIDGSYDHFLKPVSGAPDVLARLSRQHGPIQFVTARPELGPIQKWMEKILPASTINISAIGSFEKTQVLLEKKISWFVEDRLETCFPLKEAGIEPIVFKQPWNRAEHPFREVGTWQELEAMIAF